MRSPWPNTLYLDSFQPKEVVVSVFAFQAAWAVWGQCTRRLSNVVEQTIETSLSLSSGKRVGKSPARRERMIVTIVGYQHVPVANQDSIACSVGRLCHFRSLFCVASYKSRSLGDSFSEPLLAWRSEG